MTKPVDIIDTATPAVTKAISALAPAARVDLSETLGMGLQTDLSKWFAAKDRRKNAKGWTKRNFWGRIRRATALASADANGALVSISDPAIRLKLYGGVVRPKMAKYLAIPKTEEAYEAERPGLQRRELFPLMIGGRLMLADTDDKSQSLTVHWLLLKKTTHRPDPEALPPMKQLEAATLRRANSWLTRNGGIE